jgi:hypothetical protein
MEELEHSCLAVIQLLKRGLTLRRLIVPFEKFNPDDPDRWVKGYENVVRTERR